MTAAVEIGARMTPPAIDRLSWQDFANLVVEAPDTPMHVAVIAVIEGRRLTALSPRRLVARAREHVEARLDRIPEFRRVLHRAGAEPGRPMWVDDQDFRIERHVLTASVSPPGTEKELLAASEQVLERLLDRAHPLWELWILTGLSHNRFAVLLKVHHALTDGLGMLRIASVLFDGAPDAGMHEPSSWSPSPPPSVARLTSAAVVDLAGGLWRGMKAVIHPVRLATSVGGVLTTLGSVTGRTWAGRRADIRRPIGRGRRLAVTHLDLATVKRVAHLHDAKVNDVVLALAAAGVAGALRARGTDTNGVVLRTLVAVNPAEAALPNHGNRAGAVMVSLPADQAGGSDSLHEIAIDSRRARRWQRPGVVERALVGVARIRLARFLSRHQGAIELAVSNLRGPATPLYFMGCRLVDAIPVTPISGNVTIDFCALSYAGRFNVVALADAASWPDLDVVAAAMRSSWQRLRRQP